MDKLPYEILIRSNEGAYSGAHVLDTPSSLPRPIKEGDWPPIANGINEAAAAAVQSLTAQLVAAHARAELAEKETAKSNATADAIASAAESILLSESTDAEKLTALGNLIPKARAFGQAREAMALQEEAAALDAKATEARARAVELAAAAAAAASGK